MTDTTQVYFPNYRGERPVYHRQGRWPYAFCGSIVRYAMTLQLRHARFFGRPCKHCWSPEEAPRPVPITMHLAWRSA